MFLIVVESYASGRGIASVLLRTMRVPKLVPKISFEKMLCTESPVDGYPVYQIPDRTKCCV